MANITAGMVKELRELTGAGMMECKKALTETEGNMDAAVEFLRKNGQAKAEKKASRIAAEGICNVIVEGNTAVVVEVNSETDFVAKNADFQSYVASVAKQVLKSNAADVDALLEESWIDDASKTVKEALTDKIAVIGEKLTIRRFAKLTADNGAVVSYVHGGGRIGVIVSGEGASDDAAKEALSNIAMQIAAMNPQYISKSDMSAEEVAKLREITLESALNDPASLPKPILNKLIDKALADGWTEEDKATYEKEKANKFLFNFLTKEAVAKLAEYALADKENIAADKIFSGLVDGRVSKQLKDICLMEQTYVRAEDGKQSVAAYLSSVNKALTISNMVRFEVGEGIEKKVDDFAAEVAAQAGL